MKNNFLPRGQEHFYTILCKTEVCTFLFITISGKNKVVVKYSQTSLSRTRLIRITAYLEVKIWSMF